MAILPEEKHSKKQGINSLERTSRMLALIIAFISVFVFAVKILFF